MKSFTWLNKKAPRNVKQLRLWQENPRLGQVDKPLFVSDFADDFTSSAPEKDSFFDLVKSIASDGFIPYDPIVVWKNTKNHKYYVAEGNRRVLVLKLLLEPTKAPKSIRAFILAQSQQVEDKSSLEKIMVNVAPNFDAAEWYINQRNSSSTLQRKWSRIQQQSWIVKLYDKYDGNISVLKTKLSMSQSDLELIIRTYKMRKLADKDEVKSLILPEYEDKVYSQGFPITILERFFSLVAVKDQWHIENNGTGFNIKGDEQSFYIAYAAILNGVFDSKRDPQINTRTITTHLDNILSSLPKVNYEKEESDEGETVDEDNDETTDDTSSTDTPKPKFDYNAYYNRQKNNPDRPKLIVEIYNLKNGSYKLSKLFNELKKLPITYKSCMAGSLRIFLDLAVQNYIDVESIETDMATTHQRALRHITLSQRLAYLKDNQFQSGTKPHKIIVKLLNPSNEYSLDVLNGYTHSNDSHYLSKRFQFGFWDFLFPLIVELVEITEKKYN